MNKMWLSLTFIFMKNECSQELLYTKFNNLDYEAI